MKHSISFFRLYGSNDPPREAAPRSFVVYDEYGDPRETTRLEEPPIVGVSPIDKLVVQMALRRRILAIPVTQ